jgi:cyclophilin family peptidyl-prolyl cis-trans isomerase
MGTHTHLFPFCIGRYGPGPHRVKFTIDLLNGSRKRIRKTFVVETAPVDLMPTSIHLFLDLVVSGIWDDTIFLHHEETEHVIAAAPVDYATQMIKHAELSRHGWIELGFPEYTDKFPHTQYTVGFAGQGPTFYINIMDNTDFHGPGGQDHHKLPTDADPCFAKVVEGFDVVDDLVRLGSNQKKTSNQGSHPWADAVHTWTHIVSAKLLKD